MEKNLKDSAAIRIPPPVFFFICLAFGLLLKYFFHLRFINISTMPRIVVGLIFIFISGCFAGSAFFVLIKNKTTFNTAKSTIKIVKDGAYRFSRNPLYLSLLLLLTGIAVLMSSTWLLLTIPILYMLFLYQAVKPEEKYLSDKFGEEYLEYAARVRRWL